MKGLIEINRGKKIRSIRGPGFDQGSLRVQLGAKSLSGCKLEMLNKEESILALGRKL
jgi:hypothetical protein